jgi:ankyrin repeat protein
MGFMTFFQNLLQTDPANGDHQSARWFAAAAKGDTAVLRELIVRGIDIDQRDDQDRTAMNIASQYGQTDVMTTLLAARQMAYLKTIGLDPLAVPAFAPATQDTENKVA